MIYPKLICSDFIYDKLYVHCKCLQGFTAISAGKTYNICRDFPANCKYYRVFPADIADKTLNLPVNPCKHLQCLVPCLSEQIMNSPLNTVCISITSLEMEFFEQKIQLQTKVHSKLQQQFRWTASPVSYTVGL